MLPLRCALGALLALPLALAACGGSGSQDADGRITETVTTAVTTEDPVVLCEQSFAGPWVTRVYGSTAKCVSIERDNAKADTPASAAEVSGIKVDGDTATAFVEVKGGSNDGARGALSLTRDGEDWRISDLSTPFLRSQFEAGAKNDRDLPEDLKTCVVDEVTGLSDAAFRALALGSIGERPRAEAELQGIVTGCVRRAASSSTGGSETGSVLRRQFEQGVTESLQEDGIARSTIECVKRELRSAISDEQIVSLVGRSESEVPKSVARSTAAALAACDAVAE